MNGRRHRTTPSVTELIRVQNVLESDPAIRRRLRPKTAKIRKRSGEMVCFAPETVAVAQALMSQRVNPERARVATVLGVAFDVLLTNE